MTATSGPGISLYSEQISFAVGGEIPHRHRRHPAPRAVDGTRRRGGRRRRAVPAVGQQRRNAGDRAARRPTWSTASR
ncbi:MAG: hypothetical protein MZV70_02810 [Desulfobacterales bacterium]|nr:hypothetical protein [Desulfobacterales bacterium]